MDIFQANNLLGIAGTPDEVTEEFSCRIKLTRINKRWRVLMKENHPDRHVGARDHAAVTARAQVLNAAKVHIFDYYQEIIDLTMDSDDDEVSEDSPHSRDQGRGGGGGNGSPASVYRDSSLLASVSDHPSRRGARDGQGSPRPGRGLSGLGGGPTKKKARTGNGRDSPRSDRGQSVRGGGPSSRSPKFAQLPAPQKAESKLQKDEIVYLDMWNIGKIEERGVKLEGKKIEFSSRDLKVLWDPALTPSFFCPVVFVD